MVNSVLRRLVPFFLGVLLLSGCPAVRAQMGPPPGTCEITSGEASVTIPFKLIGNYVVLPAEINGREIGLILDTGMPAHGVLLHRGLDGDAYGLDFAGKAPVMGVGGGRVVADLAMGVEVGLPGLVFKDQMAIVMPYDFGRYAVFPREGMHGVIGLSLLDRFVVEVDYDKGVLILTKPASYSPPRDAEILSIELRRNLPFLACSAQMPGGETVPLNLVLDCGHSRALALNVGTQESIVLPPNAVESRVGIGATGEISGHVGRIPMLKIGGHAFEDVVASFVSGPRTGPASAEEEGNLGAEILRRFRVAFDYGNERIVLEPGKSMRDPFEHDMSGLEVSRTEDGAFAIDRVAQGCAAEDAGLTVDDVILEIMDRPAGDVGLIEFGEMMKKDGRKVTLEVVRGDAKRTVTMRLKRRI